MSAQPEEHHIMTLGQALDLAIQYHQKGHLQGAKLYYERILEEMPDQPDALHLLGVIKDQEGRHAEAEQLIRKALEITADQPEMHNNLGMALQSQKKFAEAYNAHKRATELDASYAEAFFNLGIAAKALGKKEDAVAAYQSAIALNPKYVQAMYNLGNLLYSQGFIAEAKKMYEKALVLYPSYAEVYNYLGLVLEQEQSKHKAIEHFRKAVAIKPEFAEAWSNLGRALMQDQQEEEALQCFQTATTILDPLNSEARMDLANILLRRGNTVQAYVECQKALILKDPENPQVYINLGEANYCAGKFEDALNAFLKASTLEPANALIYNYLGATYSTLHRRDEGLEALKKAVELKPNFAQALFNLAVLYEDSGRIEEARKCYESGIEIQPNPAIQFRLALLVNGMPESIEEIANSRVQMIKNLQLLTSQHVVVKNPLADNLQSNFYLAYQGENDTEIAQKITSNMLKACPVLDYTANHCRDYRNYPLSSTLKIGILSGNLVQHTIAKFNAGIIEKLPKEKFKVVLIRTLDSDPGDNVAANIDAAADKVIVLPYNLEEAYQLVAEEKLDIIFYPDIGMDVFSYFMAMARLAPVQCVTWGHPDTTGIPNLDYFLSSQLVEPEGAQGHYTEQLIQLKELPTYYFRPSHPKHLPLRAYYNLPTSAKLYVCPQSLFKMHPRFDASLAAILKKDANARLVFIEGLYTHWKEVLLKRLSQIVSDARERVIFLPRMGMPDFLNLLKLADVLLDPPYFGGGNTSYEAFAMGKPIVTWPGPFMRGRVTYGCYQKMGMLDLVAENQEEYVELAYRLANDSEWRAEMEEKVRNLSHALYKQEAVIDELTDFFTQAVKAAKKGEKITQWPQAS